MPSTLSRIFEFVPHLFMRFSFIFRHSQQFSSGLTSFIFYCPLELFTRVAFELKRAYEILLGRSEGGLCCGKLLVYLDRILTRLSFTRVAWRILVQLFSSFMPQKIRERRIYFAFNNDRREQRMYRKLWDVRNVSLSDAWKPVRLLRHSKEFIFINYGPMNRQNLFYFSAFLAFEFSFCVKVSTLPC